MRPNDLSPTTSKSTNSQTGRSVLLWRHFMELVAPNARRIVSDAVALGNHFFAVSASQNNAEVKLISATAMMLDLTRKLI